jgi:hypothetical protein
MLKAAGIGIHSRVYAAADGAVGKIRHFNRDRLLREVDARRCITT